MPSPILLIDNFDSFVFNLSRYLEELGAETIVRRNDALSVDDVASLRPAAVLLSPGPCTPAEAGICEELVRSLGGEIPMLGVCLGHQAIASALGGRVIRAPQPLHGRTSLIDHDGTGLLTGCARPLRVGRYHSLIAEESSLPPELRVTARSDDGIVMAISHRRWPLHGVQFHPESILTDGGHLLLANFLSMAGVPALPFEGRGDLLMEESSGDDFYRRAIDPEVFRPA